MPGADDLDPSLYPNDLMSLTLSPGERRLPSPLDVQIIDAVRGISPPAPSGGAGATMTTGSVSGAGSASPAVTSMVASVVAAVDQVLSDERPLRDRRDKKTRLKTEHGKKVVKGPLAHGRATSNKPSTISLGKDVSKRELHATLKRF